MAEYCTCSGRVCRTKWEKENKTCDQCLKPYLGFMELQAIEQDKYANLRKKSPKEPKEKRPHTKRGYKFEKPKARENCDHLWRIHNITLGSTIESDGYCTQCRCFVEQETIDKYKELGIKSIHK